MIMDVALMLGSLVILGVAANRWGADSRDPDVSLFKTANPPARETLVCMSEPDEDPASIAYQRPRAHLRLRLHRA
jgi:hypothetical protein